MKLDYGVGLRPIRIPERRGKQSLSGQLSEKEGTRVRRRVGRSATIDIQLDCSPLTRHDRPSSVHYAEAIVMPDAVIANYTVVMPT